VVIGGYAVAGFVACAAIDIRLLHHSAQAQDAPGMYAWGDLLLFLQVFGIGALIPTWLALYFLRPVGKFWTVFSVAALPFAATGLCAALVVALLCHQPDPSLWRSMVVAIGELREMVSPACAVIFLLATFTAPARWSRWALLGATVIEVPVGICSFVYWFAPFHVF
jgi:hypothetical protein